MRLLIAVGLLFALAGCETIEYQERCSQYGFVRRTDAYANCMQRLDMSREYRRVPRYDSPGYDYE